jgi:hypothetical protein
VAEPDTVPFSHYGSIAQVHYGPVAIGHPVGIQQAGSDTSEVQLVRPISLREPAWKPIFKSLLNDYFDVSWIFVLGYAGLAGSLAIAGIIAGTLLVVFGILDFLQHTLDKYVDAFLVRFSDPPDEKEEAAHITKG